MSRRPNRLSSAVGALVLGVALLAPLAAAPAASAAETTALLGIEKAVSAETVVPGETFSYTINVSCSSITEVGCFNAVLNDPVPAAWEVLDVSVSGAPANPPVIDGNDVAVEFRQSLGGGAFGLLDNTTATVTISVRVPLDFPYSGNGIPVTNTATTVADNAVEQKSGIDVTPLVPLLLGTDASKSIEPASALAKPGTELEVTLGGTNTSNAGVEKLIISDPADPLSAPNPFEYLDFVTPDAVMYPEGADTLVMSFWNGSEWVPGAPVTAPALPNPPPAVPGPIAADANGVRYEFSSSAAGTLIAPGASASITNTFVQNDNVSSLTGPLDIVNTVGSTVELGAESAIDADDDSYRIITEALAVTATKSFDPTAVLAGEPSTVTLGAVNSGETNLDRLTLTEPAAGSFTTDAAFVSFTAGIAYPNGATAGEISYIYADGTSETVAFADGATPAPADPSKTVASFVADFTGTIEPGSYTAIKLEVLTDPELEAPYEIPNVVKVDGQSGAAEAEDEANATLAILEKILALETNKKINPGQITSVPGELATVQLPTHLKDRPDSTTSAKTITVQDPADVANSAWWNSFDAVAITKTDVPAGASMTVRYYDLIDEEWKDLPNAIDIEGSTVFSMPIPEALRERIGGLQFVYTADTGFEPNTTVQPNFTSALREDPRTPPGASAGDGGTVANCSSAVAEAPNVTPGTAGPADPCPEITLIPVTPGEGDLIEKHWLDEIVTARSHERATARLNWSTGGYSNLERVIVSDVATAPTSYAALAASVFQAFNLVKVKPITNDPFLRYDTVLSVELFNGTDWVRASNDPCPNACAGALPGVTLTAAEQASTTSVRLVFGENTAAREGADVPLDAPLPGSGVARSSGNERAIDLVFEVRDLVRVPATDPDAALGSRLYNTATPGDVNNTASATGFTAGEQVVRDEAADIVSIIDRPLNTSVTKGWTGGPLGIPAAGTPAANYPSGRVTIVGKNSTVAAVDTLRVSDPAPGSPTPFDEFDLKDIVSISVPASSVGTPTSTVVLTHVDGSTDTLTIAQALGRTPAQLRGVVGIVVEHNGRIDKDATTRIVFDTRLRETHRDGGAPVTEIDSPVTNDTQSYVEDLGGVGAQHSATATDDSLIRLEALAIGVDTTKTFSPQSQVAPNQDPILMTLTGRPSGSARANEMVLVDDAPTFWNSMDFVGFVSPFKLAAPITRVTVDAFVGATFAEAPGNALDRTGGSWQLGTPATTPTLPAGVTPDMVQGLRFTFSRADGSQWENPANPLQKIEMQVIRRDEYRSGGEVRTDLNTNTPAPGETERGTFTNRVDADVSSALRDAFGRPLYADVDSAAAQLLYLHTPTAVVVTKTPLGAQSPGVEIPFRLEAANTGAKAIVDPVITDRIPSDANGPMLVFDPESEASPYSYELVGSAPTPPSGPPMPMEVSEVTATPSADGTEIVFTFPKGTVLEVGQRYTIVVKLMFRPGVAANTPVKNAFDITAEDDFDFCGGVAGVVDSCADDTVVYPTSVGSIRGQKLVKADDTELGTLNVVNPAQSDQCEPFAGDFFRAPCVPVTKPGGTETWRESLQNTGTLALDRLVTIDRLPTPGDSGAFVDLPRGSQWAPLWVGNVALVPGAYTPAVTHFYTTAADPCVADLRPTGAQCAAGSWLPLDSSVDPATITSVKHVFDFGSTPLLPGDSIAYTFQTRTPAVSPTVGADTIAWNTIATGARVAGGSASVLPTEGRRVGVALATGPLEVVKTVSGDGVAFAPTELQLLLQCTSAVGTPVETALEPIPLTLVDGVVQTVADLPWGAECELVDVPDVNGETSSTNQSAIVGRTSDTLERASAENVYELASLSIDKSVDSRAIDENGEAISYGPFEMSVQCTFLGEPVFADGFSAGSPMVKAIETGDSWTLDGLPAGALCTVEESDAMGAESTSVTVTTTDVPTETTDAASVDVELTAIDGDTPTVEIGFVNVFGVGSVSLEKIVDGPGAADFGQGPFTLHLECTLDDASGVRTVWNDDIVLPGEDGALTATIDNIASGAACVVTEPDSAGADTTTIAPDVPTVVGSGETIGFTVTNTFLAGSLHVLKQIEGEGAALWGAGPFEIELSCVIDYGDGPRTVDIPGGALRELNEENGYETLFEVLPNGAECSLVETKAGGATSTTILNEAGESSETIEIVSDVEAQATVTNTFEIGSVVVTKSIAGTGAEAAKDKSFTVALSCVADVDGENVQLVIPDGETRTLSAKTSLIAEYEQLPAGAECELREVENGGAASVSITPNAGDATLGVFTIAAGAAVAVSVENVFTAEPGIVTPGIASTGVEALPMALVALLVLLLGAIAVVIARRRGRRS